MILVMVCHILANNKRSQKSILSSGYHLDGRLREYAQLSNGKWTDHLIFSKLANEYKKGKKVRKSAKRA